MNKILRIGLLSAFFVTGLSHHSKAAQVDAPVVKPAKPLIKTDKQGNVKLDPVYNPVDSGSETSRLHQMNMIRDLNALAYNSAIKDDHTEEKMDAKLRITTAIIEHLESEGFKVRGFFGLTGTTKDLGKLKSFLAKIIGGIKNNSEMVFDVPGFTVFNGADMHLVFRGTHLAEGWRSDLYDKAVDPLREGIYELVSYFRLRAGAEPLSKKREKQLLELVDDIFVPILRKVSYSNIPKAVDLALDTFRTEGKKKIIKYLNEDDWKELELNIVDLVKAVQPLKGITLHAGFYDKMISSLPSLRSHFLEHYRTLTPQQIVDSVLRITGHSKGAGLSQVFAVVSDLIYIWQAQVLREKGHKETAELIEKMGNGKARRIKMHILSNPSAVAANDEDFEKLEKYLGAKKLFLIQNVSGDLITVAPKLMGYRPLGIEIFENSSDFVERLVLSDNDFGGFGSKEIVHRHYGDRAKGFAHEEATDISHSSLLDKIKETASGMKKKLSPKSKKEKSTK